MNPRPSAWAPLAYPVFRTLWAASLVSFIGTFMHDVGDGWLITTLTHSPAIIALLPACLSLPIFLFSLPAGAMADVLDRRALLLASQVWMLLSAAALAVLTATGAITTWMLLALTFSLGTGAAITIPPWQATIPELVPTALLPSAVALGSIAFNVARGIGPAIGGTIVSSAGPAGVFALNALTFLVVIVALLRWKRPPGRAHAPVSHIVRSMRDGVTFTTRSHAMHAVIVRTMLFTLAASVLWAMLPILARHRLHLPASGYGWLVSCMGGGALAGAVALPVMRARLSPNVFVAIGSALFAGACVVFATTHAVWIACAGMFACGFAWLGMMTTFNVSVQTSTPDWVRGRALSIYILTFHGAFALGSIVWGAVAERTSLVTAFLCAAGAMLAGLGTLPRFALPHAAERNHGPSVSAPAPVPVAQDGA